jgi:hypothetical protein
VSHGAVSLWGPEHVREEDKAQRGAPAGRVRETEAVRRAASRRDPGDCAARSRVSAAAGGDALSTGAGGEPAPRYGDTRAGSSVVTNFVTNSPFPSAPHRASIGFASGRRPPLGSGSDTVRRGGVWCGSAWSGLVRHGTAWSGEVWRGWEAAQGGRSDPAPFHFRNRWNRCRVTPPAIPSFLPPAPHRGTLAFSRFVGFPGAPDSESRSDSHSRPPVRAVREDVVSESVYG